MCLVGYVCALYVIRCRTTMQVVILNYVCVSKSFCNWWVVRNFTWKTLGLKCSSFALFPFSFLHSSNSLLPCYRIATPTMALNNEVDSSSGFFNFLVVARIYITWVIFQQWLFRSEGELRWTASIWVVIKSPSDLASCQSCIVTPLLVCGLVLQMACSRILAV